MYLERSLFGVILTSFASLSFGWEYGQPREEQTNYSAWYQLPNPAPSGAYSPASAAYDRERSSYDRAPPPTYDRSQPSVYERERERERPSSYPRRTPPEPFYPEASGALPNNLLPQPRTPPAGMVVGAFYPGVQPGSPSSSGRRLTQDVATTQDPNAELLAAIKDVVKKFRASLDRSGVHDDIRHMGQQLENTWNEMRRGVEKSWMALRQSAESAVIPSQFGGGGAESGAPVALVKAQDAPLAAVVAKYMSEPSLASHVVKNFTSALNRMQSPTMLKPTAANLSGSSGKFDQWMERANRALADALIEPKEPMPAQENDEKKISKKLQIVAKKSMPQPTYAETRASFSTNPGKTKSIMIEKKKPTL